MMKRLYHQFLRPSPETWQKYLEFKLRNNLCGAPSNNYYIGLKTSIFGKELSNPIGVAAGFDKYGKLFNKLFDYGYSNVEIGTVTYSPRKGNQKPRTFWKPGGKSVINLMGFNNDGIHETGKRIESNRKFSRHRCEILGLNISVPIPKRSIDFVTDFRLIHNFAQSFYGVDYITLNISSPNTPGLRSFADNPESFDKLLSTVLQRGTGVLGSLRFLDHPVVVKIPPNLGNSQINEIVDIAIRHKIAGLVVSNTLDGESGSRIFGRSTRTLAQAYTAAQGKLELIASGGVMDHHTALTKIHAGASLVQVYTGILFQGFPLYHQISRGLSNEMLRLDTTIQDQIGRHAEVLSIEM